MALLLSAGSWSLISASHIISVLSAVFSCAYCLLLNEGQIEPLHILVLLTAIHCQSPDVAPSSTERLSAQFGTSDTLMVRGLTSILG